MKKHEVYLNEVKQSFKFELGQIVKHRCRGMSAPSMVVIGRAFEETIEGSYERYTVSCHEMGTIHRRYLSVHELDVVSKQ